jgi:hypothetical protein
MTKTNLNPTIDDYRGSIGKLVFKKYRGRTIVAKKPVITAEPSQAQVAQRIRFKEAAAFGKFAQNDPALCAIYEPIAQMRQVTVYTVAVQDYLKKPVIKLLDLFEYKGRVGDHILIEASDEVGLASLDVTLESNDGTLIESGQPVESAPGTGKWTYKATVAVPYGSDIFIHVVAVDHAGNRTKLSKSPRVGVDEE